MNYKFSDSVEIPNMPGGGIPTCPEFYRNPQIVVSADKDKLKTADAKKPFEALFTYKTHNPNTQLKIYVCNTDAEDPRIYWFEEDIIVDFSEDVSYSFIA